MTRIALIHALTHSLAPINDALARSWPEATRVNLLDDSLSADLARSGTLDAAMTQRFITLADYAVNTGADAILFTCSAFGRCIDAVKVRHAGIPVLKPNEAMIDEAVALAQERGGSNGSIGLLASFAPTLPSMLPEFPAGVQVQTALAQSAMAALNRGDMAAHDAAVLEASDRLVAAGCSVIALAQFSMARTAAAVAAHTGLPVLTTPDTAVRRLRVLLRCA